MLDFRLRDVFFDHGDEYFGEVVHGDQRFEFDGDFFRIFLGLAECLSQSVYFDFGKERFEGRDGFPQGFVLHDRLIWVFRHYTQHRAGIKRPDTEIPTKVIRTRDPELTPAELSCMIIT